MILFLKPNSVERLYKKNAFQFTNVKDHTLNKSGGKKLSFDKQVFFIFCNLIKVFFLLSELNRESLLRDDYLPNIFLLKFLSFHFKSSFDFDFEDESFSNLLLMLFRREKTVVHTILEFRIFVSSKFFVLFYKLYKSYLKFD